MRGLARAGLAARGVNYPLIGSLAIQIALGSRGTQADTTGALRAVAKHPGGSVVLWLLAAGFAGLALWRFAETAYGQAGPGGRTAPKRLTSLALGVLYGCICGIVINFIVGVGRGTSKYANERVVFTWPISSAAPTRRPSPTRASTACGTWPSTLSSPLAGDGGRSTRPSGRCPRCCRPR
jgi:hypothetical protein